MSNKWKGFQQTKRYFSYRFLCFRTWQNENAQFDILELRNFKKNQRMRRCNSIMQLSQVLIKHILGRICKTNFKYWTLTYYYMYCICTFICMYFLKNTLQSQWTKDILCNVRMHWLLYNIIIIIKYYNNIALILKTVHL